MSNVYLASLDTGAFRPLSEVPVQRELSHGEVVQDSGKSWLVCVFPLQGSDPSLLETLPSSEHKAALARFLDLPPRKQRWSSEFILKTGLQEREGWLPRARRLGIERVGTACRLRFEVAVGQVDGEEWQPEPTVEMLWELGERELGEIAACATTLSAIPVRL
jgi:hypothetical protein